MRQKKEETKQIRILAKLHKLVKIMAAREGRKMSELVNALLGEALETEGYGK